MDFATLRTILFTIAFVGFAGVTITLLALTVRNRLRAPHAVLTWTDRLVWRSALWPLAFIVLMGVCTVLAAGGNPSVEVWQLAGLMLCGMCWLAAVVLAHTVIVTEEAIVVNVNHPEKSVVWDEVVDYFEGGPAPWHYAFFYHNAAGRRVRQDVWVPRPLRRHFGQLVGELLEHRFEEVSTPPSRRRETLG